MNNIENLVEVYGDILEAKDRYIARQCNCTSSNYKGLSKAIVTHFPWATFYLEDKRKPGTISIKGTGDQRKIIGMYAQRYIGYPSDALHNNQRLQGPDTYALRLNWFESCLNEISMIPDIQSIGFPKNIGCGLAGGNWEDYFKLISRFALENKHIQITIYEYKCSA